MVVCENLHVIHVYMCVFSVAVELSDGELLIPSALPCERPNLPHNAFPLSVVSAAVCGCVASDSLRQSALFHRGCCQHYVILT